MAGSAPMKNRVHFKKKVLSAFDLSTEFVAKMELVEKHLTSVTWIHPGASGQQGAAGGVSEAGGKQQQQNDLS